MSDTTDQLLVTRVRRGEPDAWEELIARYEGRLRAFVGSRLGNRSTSEDVVQETFLGFLTSLPNYDSERTRLESFLFAIAAHKLTDVLRRQGRRPTLPLLPSGESSSGMEPAGPARAASSLMRSREGRSGEADLIGETLAELIGEWLAGGQLERLKCLELLLVLGWRNKDTAAHLGISEQAVANHKSFVIRKLKDAAQRSQVGTIDLVDFGLDESTTDALSDED
ncbi:MAG: RNA polymerase subunit sigma-70 [Planctomycetaceae bacterium]|jgi:RNA polymerase sigma-70 factor (ECF subfamily)|nr:RNA polymerase subunit sigma-70 [Planctomycetaceae bacterium]